jgi:hypothetical protein
VRILEAGRVPAGDHEGFQPDLMYTLTGIGVDEVRKNLAQLRFGD